MAVERRYRCCEHCAGDPWFHTNEPADSHTVPCSTKYRGYPGCEVGDQAVRFDTETGMVVTDG